MDAEGTAVKDAERNQNDTVTRIGADDARPMFGELLDRAWDGEDIAITRHSRERAVLVGWREYERLRAVERSVVAESNARTSTAKKRGVGAR